MKGRVSPSQLTQVEPAGNQGVSPSQALQEGLDDVRGATKSGTLESIMSQQQPAATAEIDSSKIIPDKVESDPVEDKLKLAKAPNLQVEAQSAAELAARDTQQFESIMQEADKDLYFGGELRRQERALGLNTDRYNFQGGKRKNTLTSNGGIFERAEEFANVILDPTKPIGISGLLHPKPEVENQINQTSNLGTLFQKIQATNTDQNTGKQVINPEFLRIASLITEDVFADQTMGESRKEEQKRKTATADFGEQLPEEFSPDLKITKMQRNNELGNRIVEAWSKVSGVPKQDIDKQTASFLGDAMKELYYEVNRGSPEAQNIVRVQPEGSKQVEFQITSHGQYMFQQSEAIRKLYFPKEHVDALDAPRSSGKIRVSGANKPLNVRDYEAILEAVQVLESVPHWVVPRREKILLATLLPALANAKAIQEARKNGTDPKLMEGMTAELNEMFAGINGFGSDKYAAFEARKKIAALDGRDDFNVEANMEVLQRNIAQALFGIAKHRNAPVYLTYFVQAFNGRLTPEQTHFNPVSNKQVRFVTGNPEPVVITPGSNNRLEQNLKEAYSMMILKMNGVDAGDTLQSERLRMFDEGYDQLVAFGKDLKEALDNTDINADEISKAILNGLPLDHPNFPKFQGLQIDPSRVKLITSITKKGEDGLGLIDGLIDLYEYDQVLKHNKNLGPNDRPRTFLTHYNAYIDGKTNGLASNGAQLGIRETALRTGVLRSDDSIYAVEDNKDMRDVLAERLKAALNGPNAFRDTTYAMYGGFATEFHMVVDKLFQTRNLNKATTMTFGYGKELESFKSDLRNYLVLNKTEADAAANALSGMVPSSLSDKDLTTLQLSEAYKVLEASYKGEADNVFEALVDDVFDMYIDQLVEVITPDGIKARKMMYNMAMFHVMMDELFELETPTGMPQYLGGIDLESSQEVEQTSYDILTPNYPEGKPRKELVRGVELEQPMFARGVSALSMQKKATASAVRGEGEGGYIGGAALGGSNPAVVQSIDAATVARTFSGKSADKLRNANARGTVYALQIYDAFKSDMNNFDIIYNEVNQNWLQVNKDYFYLEMAHNKMNETSAKFAKKMMKNSGELVSVGMESGFRKIGDFLAVKVSNAGTKQEKVNYPSLEAFLKRNLDPFKKEGGSRVKKSRDELKAEAEFRAAEFIKKLEKAGINAGSTQLTKGQILTFIKMMGDEINFKNEREKFIFGKIKPQREKNFAEIDREQKKGNRVAQYHAH